MSTAPDPQSTEPIIVTGEQRKQRLIDLISHAEQGETLAVVLLMAIDSLLFDDEDMRRQRQALARFLRRQSLPTIVE